MDISPDKQNIDELFGTTAYYIDFYQRDYKWTEEPVRRLLDDIFYAFDVAYEANKALLLNRWQPSTPGIISTPTSPTRSMAVFMSSTASNG
jgi:hypothetical protein